MPSPASPSEIKTSEDRSAGSNAAVALTKGAGSQADLPLSSLASPVPISPSHWRIRQFTESIGRGFGEESDASPQRAHRD